MRVCPRCRSIYSVPVERCGIDGTPIVDQPNDPLVGTAVDRYQVIEPLGRGAMGCVYRAKHNVLPTECAIKVLYGNYAVNQRLIERFRREAQAIGKMNHPNIVSVNDFGMTESGLTFLVMELVEGVTLEKLISAEAPFTPERTAGIARQLASGLSEAHRRGFVHRDMKPANVMIAERNGFDVVKILDFGVVGMLQAAAMAKLTAAGHIVGTPSYMAPEQARTSTVTQAADLYALGCIIYEMLEAIPPFEGMGVAEVLVKHMNERPIPPAEARGLERIAMWLLEKDPEKRPSSAMRVIAEIDRLNLGTANTEQILVSRVKNVIHGQALDAETEKHDKKVLSEFDETAPVEVFHDPAERVKSAPTDHSEHDTADIPVSLIAKDARDPSDEDAPAVNPPPALIAPPLDPHLDVTQRPILEHDKTTPLISMSFRDTEKPGDLAARAKVKEAERAVMALMQSETVRDTPVAKPTKPPKPAPAPVTVKTWAIVVVLAAASVATLFYTFKSP